jgi:hypothetical protein
MGGLTLMMDLMMALMKGMWMTMVIMMTSRGMNVKTIIKGSLLETQMVMLGEPDVELDKSDVGLTVNKPTSLDKLDISHCFLPVWVRQGGLNIRQLRSKKFSGDGLLAWCGGINIGRHVVRDKLPYFYSRRNHKDVAQFLTMDPVSFKRNQAAFVGLYIGYANVVIRGARKAGYHFTEICQYRDVVLFPKGVVFNTDSEYPYFISTTNATNWVIGSPECPVVPEMVSHKAIRIGAKEDQGAPGSKNITIHAYPGLKLELNKSARAATSLVEYPKGSSKKQRIEMFNDIDANDNGFNKF